MSKRKFVKQTKIKTNKPTSTICITFGDQAENHVGPKIVTHDKNINRNKIYMYDQ